MNTPTIAGDWWTIAGVPDLGRYNTNTIEPMDFSVWQAADGSWQLGACVRGTACGGHGRLLYRWESPTLKQPDWAKCGVLMLAEPSFGETAGGLQAPYVIRHEGHYYMFYGDWTNICLANGEDGKTFARHLRDGRSALFNEGSDNFTRGPMVARYGSAFFLYYTAVVDGVGAIFCRTSTDLHDWSESQVVSRGGSGGTGPADAECAFAYRRGSAYYLLRWHSDGNTSVYRSNDPLNFGIDSDDMRVATLPVEVARIIENDGYSYLTSLRPDLQGIRLANLKWK